MKINDIHDLLIYLSLIGLVQVKRSHSYASITAMSLRSITVMSHGRINDSPVAAHFTTEGHTESDMAVMIIDRCWREHAILRKIRKSRWIRMLDTAWPSVRNYKTDGLYSSRSAHPSSQTMPCPLFITEQINIYLFIKMMHALINCAY